MALQNFGGYRTQSGLGNASIGALMGFTPSSIETPIPAKKRFRHVHELFVQNMFMRPGSNSRRVGTALTCCVKNWSNIIAPNILDRFGSGRLRWTVR